MGTHMGHVFTLANSIIGVSVLAMPFCFRQCGIALSILMLFISSHISRLACHYLMKSAILERIKNFEMLAFRAFGSTGKLLVEMSIIGFMLGTCVAFFVVIGDLGPNILGPLMGLEHPSALRPSVLIGTAVFVVLPLGLLRNVDSLNGICAASLAFYGVLVLKLFLESTTNLFDPHVWSDLDYWKPSGLLRCIPIFSMALSCQTQLFEVFGSLPTTPLDRANAVVKSAVNLTTFFYIAVGTFGCIAYANAILTGNVMMNFSAGASSEIIKICFLMSVAVSFPLVIFPCRASIYSFLYSKIQHSYEGFGSSHIPETQFQCITLLIVTLSLVIGLMIPNIEIVLGLVGSTLGVFVCVITPGLIFTTVSMKKNNERLVAQIIVGAGIVIMVLGTYANLYATEETFTAPLEKIRLPEPLKKREKIAVRSRAPNVIKDVAQMEKVLRQLEFEEKLQRKPPEKNDEALKKESKVVGPKAFSPEISDHNPQPVRSEEGPKPQPVAPEPPEQPLKKIPINIPESLQNLEVAAKKTGDDKAAPPVAPPVGGSEVIKKAGNNEDPAHQAPPGDEPSKNALPSKSEPKPDQASSDDHAEKPKSREQLNEKDEKSLKAGAAESQPVVGQQSGKEQEGKPSLEQKEVPKQPPVIPEVEQAARTPAKDNLSISMAQGVPLPLAVKSLENEAKHQVEPKKVGREILEKPLDREQREKRDLEALGKKDDPETSLVETLDAALQGKSTSQVALGEGEPHVLLEFEKSDGSSDNHAQGTPTPSERRDVNLIEKSMKMDGSPCKEPCQKNLLQSEPQEMKYVMDGALKKDDPGEECIKTTAKTKEASTTSLIKSPQKLTNEDPILPGNADLPQPKERAEIVDSKIGKQKK